MRIYSVYLPQQQGDENQLEDAVFIKDGFSWPALCFSVFWFAFHKMWIVAGVLASAFILSGWGLAKMDINPEISFLVHIGLAVVFAFEADNLRGWHLKRKGFEYYAGISGHGLMEAEEKFFQDWYEAQNHTGL